MLAVQQQDKNQEVDNSAVTEKTYIIRHTVTGNQETFVYDASVIERSKDIPADIEIENSAEFDGPTI